MKRFMILVLLSAFSSFYVVNGMDLELPSDIILLKNSEKNKLFSIPKNLVPFYDLKRHENTIDTYLEDDFIELLKQLLYVSQGMKCTGRFDDKCMKDIKRFFTTVQLAQSNDFASWFEFIFLFDMFDFPLLIKDELLCHVTKLIKGHEEEAAKLTLRSAYKGKRRISYMGIWQDIITFYNLLFDAELEIDGVGGTIKGNDGYSLQQLIVCNKIDDSCFSTLEVKNQGDIFKVNLENLKINSLIGWELLISLFEHKFSIKYGSQAFNDVRFAFDFSDNMISFIPNNFLTTITNNVYGLSISNNYLSSVPNNFCADMPHLTILNLSSNNLKVFSDKFLFHTPSLLILNLENNWLTKIPVNICSRIPGLQCLYLMFNEITILPDDFFTDIQSTQHLKKLSLAYNKIKNLPVNFCSQVPNMITMSFRGNKLSVLPDNFLSQAPELLTLNLSKNAIVRLPESFLVNSHKLDLFAINNGSVSISTEYLPPHVVTALAKGDEYIKERAEKRQQAQKRSASGDVEGQPEQKRQKQ